MMNADEVFVAKSAPAGVFATRDRSQARWLKAVSRFQDVLLLVWFAFVCFFPQNLLALTAAIGLFCVWGFAVVVGIWHAIKVPTSRRLAAWVISAFPLAVILLMLLDNTIGIPLVGNKNGEWLFFAAILIFPLYWLVRWLMRSTNPKTVTPRGTRIRTVIFFSVACMLMLHAFLLIGMLFFGDSFSSFRRWFGGDWYTNLVIITLGSAVLLAIITVPYTIIGFIRGTEHKGAMIGVLIFTAITIVCTFGLLALFSVLASMG